MAAYQAVLSRHSVWLRFLRVIVIAGYYECKFAGVRLLRCKNPCLRDGREKRRDRGMSVRYDWGLIGGLPLAQAL